MFTKEFSKSDEVDTRPINPLVNLTKRSILPMGKKWKSDSSSSSRFVGHIQWDMESDKSRTLHFAFQTTVTILPCATSGTWSDILLLVSPCTEKGVIISGMVGRASQGWLPAGLPVSVLCVCVALDRPPP